MRLLSRIFILLIFICFAFTALAYFLWYKPSFKVDKNSFALVAEPVINSKRAINKKLMLNAVQLKKYSALKNYNTNYCFMMDMNLPSGKQRFYIYNLQKDSIELAGLVTHGSGSITDTDELFFSNEPGSSCTSLGKYKIGKSYMGRFGLAYKLHGLDKTNNKAFERFVVLHGHSCVPATEVFPLSICPSLGCPTVAPAFLQKLSSYIDESEKPILLEIYK